MKRIGYILGLSFLIQAQFCSATQYDEMFKEKLKISNIKIIHEGGSVFDITTSNKQTTRCDISKWNNPGGGLIYVQQEGEGYQCTVYSAIGSVSFCWLDNVLTVLNSSYHGNVAVKADNIRVLNDNKFHCFYAQSKTFENQGSLGAQEEITLFSPQMSLGGSVVTDENIWNGYKWPTASNNNYHVDASSLSQNTLYNSGLVKGSKIEIRDLDVNNIKGVIDAEEIIYKGRRYLGSICKRVFDPEDDPGYALQKINQKVGQSKYNESNLNSKNQKDQIANIHTFQRVVQTIQSDTSSSQRNWSQSILIDQHKQELINACVDSRQPERGKRHFCNFKFVNEDSYEAAKSLKSPCVLNMANAIEPGGGVLKGCIAQEESLCRASSLYFSLLGRKLEEYYYSANLAEISSLEKFGNLPDGYMPGTGRSFITPNVTVFDKKGRFNVAVISGAAVHLGSGKNGHKPGWGLQAKQNGYITREQVEDDMRRFIRDLIRSLIYYGYKNIVLGALGCGAFDHKAETVSKLFHQVLVNEGYGYWFDNVVFAILSDGNGQFDKLEVFKKTFKAEEEKDNPFDCVWSPKTINRQNELLQFDQQQRPQKQQNKKKQQLQQQHSFNEYIGYIDLGCIDQKNPGRHYMIEKDQHGRIFAMAKAKDNNQKLCLREIGDDEKQVVLKHLQSEWLKHYPKRGQFKHAYERIEPKIAEIVKKLYEW